MSYAGTDELARVLKIRTPSAQAGSAMQVALDAAYDEINAEIGTVHGTPYPALAIQVNVERAVEHWQQAQSPFGILGLGSDVPVRASSDSWSRHAAKLAPLKVSWGIA